MKRRYADMYLLLAHRIPKRNAMQHTNARADIQLHESHLEI